MNLTAKNSTIHTVSIPIEHLYHLEGIEEPQINEFVRESVAEVGLIEPLSIWACTVYEWINKMEGIQGVRTYPEGAELEGYDLGNVYLMVRTGNNRLRAAKALGYTHIDCNIFIDYDVCMKHVNVALNRSKYWKKPFNKRIK